MLYVYRIITSLERRVAQHTFTHASLISESSATLTNLPTPEASCIVQPVRQASALMHERGHALPQIVNSEQCYHFGMLKFDVWFDVTFYERMK